MAIKVFEEHIVSITSMMSTEILQICSSEQLAKTYRITQYYSLENHNLTSERHESPEAQSVTKSIQKFQTNVQLYVLRTETKCSQII
jgi:hypothetical protein